MQNTEQQETGSICRDADTEAATVRISQPTARDVISARPYFAQTAAVNVWVEILFPVADIQGGLYEKIKWSAYAYLFTLGRIRMRML